MPTVDPEKQRSFAVEVTRQLREAGFEAYWAGGCVRDNLLGLRAKDYDVATSATPVEIRKLFGQRKTLAIGAAFGVITVLGPRGAGQIEVATFRQDAAYSDGRHPDSVTFSSAEEDAKRRDFTINGLFYDPLEQRVIDFVDGQADLARKIVRAIGDPQQRIAEDKLRMLRAVRFAAKFAFTLDAGTAKAIGQMTDGLSVVSAERIAMEMRHMLVDPHRGRAVSLLRETGLLGLVLGDDIALPGEDGWRRTLNLLEKLAEPTVPLALATLLLEMAGAEQARQLGRRWRLSNQEVERTVWLVRHAHSLDDASDLYWPDLQALLIHEGIEELLGLLAARVAIGSAGAADLQFCRQRLAWPGEQLDPRPLLTGDDLVEHGLKPGKLFARLLRKVREAQLTGQVSTRGAALQMIDRLVEESDA